jgi:hypothetical protein
MFQNYLSYSPSSWPNHETVPRRFDHRIGDQVKVVDTENAFDLSRESSQESEISSGHPYEAGHDFRDEWFIRKRDSGGRPALLE